jgi:hypothetical protein
MERELQLQAMYGPYSSLVCRVTIPFATEVVNDVHIPVEDLNFP